MNVIKGWLAKGRALAGTPLGQQVGRFVRLAAVTAVTAWVGGGHVLSKAAIWGAVVGGVEVAYRQARPALSGALSGLGVPDVLPDAPPGADPSSAAVSPVSSNVVPFANSTTSAPPDDAGSPHQGA